MSNDSKPAPPPAPTPPSEPSKPPERPERPTVMIFKGGAKPPENTAHVQLEKKK